VETCHDGEAISPCGAGNDPVQAATYPCEAVTSLCEVATSPCELVNGHVAGCDLLPEATGLEATGLVKAGAGHVEMAIDVELESDHVEAETDVVDLESGDVEAVICHGEVVFSPCEVVICHDVARIGHDGLEVVTCCPGAVGSSAGFDSWVFELRLFWAHHTSCILRCEQNCGNRTRDTPNLLVVTGPPSIVACVRPCHCCLVSHDLCFWTGFATVQLSPRS
jgi:hypothetical protein